MNIDPIHTSQAREITRFMFLPHLGVVGIPCRNESAAIAVSVARADGKKVLLQNTFYRQPGESQVTIYGLDALIEPYFGSSAELDVEVECDGELATGMPIRVLYCNRTPGSEVGIFIQNNFLTSRQGVQHTSPGFKEYLHVYARKAGEGNVTALYCNVNGEVATHEYPFKINGGIACMDVSPSKYDDGRYGKLASYTVTVGEASMRYLVIPSDTGHCIGFKFMNCFNLPETVYLKGGREFTPSYERTTLECNGMQLPCEVKETMNLKLSTGTMPRGAAHIIHDLVRRGWCRGLSDGLAYIVTDSSASFADTPGSIPEMNVTMRRADGREAELMGADPLSVFDLTFDPTYV